MGLITVPHTTIIMAMELVVVLTLTVDQLMEQLEVAVQDKVVKEGSTKDEDPEESML